MQNPLIPDLPSVVGCFERGKTLVLCVDGTPPAQVPEALQQLDIEWWNTGTITKAVAPLSSNRTDQSY